MNINKIIIGIAILAISGTSFGSIYDSTTVLTQDASIGAVEMGKNNPNVSITSSNGAAITARVINVGNTLAASNTTLTVTGNGTRWTSDSALKLGEVSQNNSLLVSDGASMQHIGLTLGNAATSTGNNLTVSGASSSYTNDNSSLNLGFRGGNNAINVYAGAKFINTSSISIGSYAGSDGNSITVSGAGSAFINNFSMTMIAASGNSIMISDGGTLQNTRANMGNGSTSHNNTATVTGPGSSWINTSTLYVGNDGANNALLISDGGLVTATAIRQGNSSASTGNSIHVTGTNSILSSTGELYVGYHGDNNQLLISDGGVVSNTSARVGHTFNAQNNSIIITDAGSRWANNLKVEIGIGGNENAVTITNHGSVYIGGDLSLGSKTSLRVEKDSTLQIGGNISVAEGGFFNIDGSLVFDRTAGSSTTFSGHLQMGENGLLVFDLSASENDLLDLNGNLTLDNGGLLLVFDAGTINEGDTFKVIDWGGTVSGTFGSVRSKNDSTSWDTSRLYDEGVLVAIPEPAILSFILLGGATLLGINRYTHRS